MGGRGSRCFEESVRVVCRIRFAVPEIATGSFIRPPLQDSATRLRSSADVEVASTASFCVIS